MRVCVLGQEFEPFKTRLVEQGEDLVSLEQQPELILTKQRLAKQVSCLVIGGDWDIPKPAVAAMGLSLVQALPSFVLTKWFDGEYRDQTVLTIPVFGLMEEGMGAQLPAGCGTRFIKPPDFVQTLFNNTMLRAMLAELHYNGFVSFVCSFDGLVGVCLGSPFGSFYNLVESISGRLTDFFVGEQRSLLESWSVSLRLSRYPFPAQAVSSKAQVNGINLGMEKHLWLYGLKGVHKQFYVEDTDLGYATAWSPELNEACRRVLRTLRNVELKEKQFRTDLASSIGEVLFKCREKGLLTHASD